MFTPPEEFQRSMPGLRQLAQSACLLKSLTKIKSACYLNKLIKPTDFQGYSSCAHVNSTRKDDGKESEKKRPKMLLCDIMKHILIA